MEKRYKKSRALALGCGEAGVKMLLILLLFLPAYLAFTPSDQRATGLRHIVKVVEVKEKPRTKELVKIYSIVRSHRPDLSDSDAWRVSEAIRDESSKRGIDPMLVLAVIKIESGFQSASVSPMGARGIMQIMPDTGKFLSETLSVEHGTRAASFRPESLDDPLLNIRLGVYYLHDLRKQFQNWHHALVAYNVGPGEIQNRLENNVAFSDEFAAAVLDIYQNYKRAKPPVF